MHRATGRPPNIADGMILIGAVALGLWMSQWWGRFIVGHGTSSRIPAAVYSGYLTMLYAPTFVVSQAILILRLREPRPTRFRLRRQPGFVASVAVALMAILHTAHSCMSGVWQQVWLERPYGFGLWVNNLLYNMTFPYSIAPAVVVAWTVQVMVGAWRPEPSWIDRFGRAVGWTWIALWIVATIIRQFLPW